MPLPHNIRLLSRDDFRKGVFARDDYKCVVCHAPAVDAHHIMERRLFPDGGYYLDNGASVCAEHHLEAERTLLSCEQVREAAKIRTVLLPPHLYSDQPYDKWGNPILANGTRLRGELYFDASVQKVLGEGGVLSIFTHLVKFPRTYHLPWSPGMTKDDRKMEAADPFKDRLVVATLKMDGENTTMYQDYIHARSLTYDPHPSRSWVKARWAQIAHDIPKGWRVCGENVYATHSIAYQHLEDWFLVFQVWDDRNVCLSWEDTKEWAELLGFSLVPTLYVGEGSRANIENLHVPERDGDPCEGYVVRESGPFAYAQYRTAVGKYVRAGHVATHGHWMRQSVRPNGRR